MKSKKLERMKIHRSLLSARTANQNARIQNRIIFKNENHPQLKFALKIADSLKSSGGAREEMASLRKIAEEPAPVLKSTKSFGVL